MKKYIGKKTERVVEIIGDEFATHKYVFGKASRIDVQTLLAGALRGGVSPFVTAHASADRTSDAIQVNVMRVPAYHVIDGALPADILLLIASLDTLKDDPDKVDELEEVVQQLDNYFNLD